MATKQFDYQFEDIRREDTPVTAAGFGDMVEEPANPDEAFVEVDLSEDDTDKAVQPASVESRSNGKGGDKAGDKDAAKDKRREVLTRRREVKKVADEAVNEARKEVAGEVNALKAKVAKLESGQTLDTLEAKYADDKERIETAMEAAMEAGESDKFTALNTELVELNNKLTEERLEAKREHVPDAPQDLDAGADTSEKPVSKRAQGFVQANLEWWTDPDHDIEVDYAKRLDLKLVEMGLHPETNRYWEAFNRNFDKKYPDLRVTDSDDIDVDLDLDDPPSNRRAKSPVSAPGAGGGNEGPKNPRNAGGSKVRLTASDKVNMQRFGLDPTDAESCRQYAMNKVQPKQG